MPCNTTLQYTLSHKVRGIISVSVNAINLASPSHCTVLYSSLQWWRWHPHLFQEGICLHPHCVIPYYSFLQIGGLGFHLSILYHVILYYTTVHYTILSYTNVEAASPPLSTLHYSSLQKECPSSRSRFLNLTRVPTPTTSLLKPLLNSSIVNAQPPDPDVLNLARVQPPIMSH